MIVAFYFFSPRIFINLLVLSTMLLQFLRRISNGSKGSHLQSINFFCSVLELRKFLVYVPMSFRVTTTRNPESMFGQILVAPGKVFTSIFFASGDFEAEKSLDFSMK